jgi:hypothetical protein
MVAGHGSLLASSLNSMVLLQQRKSPLWLLLGCYMAAKCPLSGACMAWQAQTAAALPVQEIMCGEAPAVDGFLSFRGPAAVCLQAKGTH